MSCHYITPQHRPLPRPPVFMGPDTCRNDYPLELSPLEQITAAMLEPVPITCQDVAQFPLQCTQTIALVPPLMDSCLRNQLCWSVEYSRNLSMILEAQLEMQACFMRIMAKLKVDWTLASFGLVHKPQTIETEATNMGTETSKN